MGTLPRSQYPVLTAAHCLYEGNVLVDFSEITVFINPYLFGAITEGEEFADLLSYKIHPDYVNSPTTSEVSVLSSES